MYPKSEDVKLSVPPVTVHFLLNHLKNDRKLYCNKWGSVAQTDILQKLGSAGQGILVLVPWMVCCPTRDIYHPWRFGKNPMHFFMYFWKVRNQLNHTYIDNSYMPRNILHYFVFGKFHFDFWGFEIMQLGLSIVSSSLKIKRTAL